jgi:hypothetical protein
MEDKSAITRHFLRSSVAAGLPFLWTVGAGLLAGLAAAALGWVVGFHPGKSAAFAAAVVVTICYPTTWAWWANKLEEINRPPKLSRQTRIEIYLDGGKQVRPSTLNATPDELHAIAVKLMAGARLSGRAMAGIMPPDRFYYFQSQLVEAKLAKARSANHKDGVELTELGKRVFDRLAAPIPQAEAVGEWDVLNVTHREHRVEGGE